MSESDKSDLLSILTPLLPSTDRKATAFQFASGIGSKLAFLLPLFGGVDGLIAASHKLYDEYVAPYDVPGLEDDTEAAYDVANKLALRDLIRKAAEAIG